VLCHGQGILPVDFFCGELHIEADALAQHVPCEDMPKPVWVGFGQIGDTTVMAE
jgi:hypothetical protein